MPVNDEEVEVQRAGWKKDPSCTILSWTIFHGFSSFFLALLLWCCSKIKGPIFGFLWARSSLHPVPRRWVCSQDFPHLVAATATVPLWFSRIYMMTCNASLYCDLYKQFWTSRFHDMVAKQTHPQIPVLYINCVG